MAQTKVGSGFVATGAVGPTSLSTGAPYWDTSGNVGIGISSPSYKLDVGSGSGLQIIRVNGGATNSSDGGALFIGNAGTTVGAFGNYSGIIGGAYNADPLVWAGPSRNLIFVTGGGANERMRIDSSGNVGIGTASPSTILHLYAATPTLSITSTTTTGTTIGNKGNRLLLISNSVTAGNGGEVVFAGADTNVGRAGAISFYYTNGDLTSYAGAITFATKLQADTALTERMRIDSSGNVGIGTSSPSYKLHVSGNIGAPASRIDVTGITDANNQGFRLAANTDTYLQNIGALQNSLVFNQWNGSSWFERMRIDSSGNVQIGTTGGPAPINVFRSTTGNPVGIFKATSTSFDNDLLQLTCSRAGATTQYLALSFYTNNYGTLQAYMRADGNWYNANSVYGSTSDARLKENIIDATPKLDSLCQLKVRNFNFISDENKTKQIGFVAQEFEEVFPSMVDENKDGDKTIKTSVLIPMLVKAIQELTAKVTALEAKVGA